MKRGLAITLAAVVLVGVGVTFAVVAREGRIGPDNRIQPSGRQLDPVGKLTRLGNHPGGGALTTNGRFLWTLSAGRGHNNVRIVEVRPALDCESGAAGRECREERARRVGRVVQKIPMPGVNGGIVMAPDGETAYVSGTPESGHEDQEVPDRVPGQGGDTIHVFKYDRVDGRARRAGTIDVPAPSDVPPPQSFPPTNTARQSWPRDLAISGDGKTMLAALNLADYAAIIDTKSKDVEYVKIGRYPYGAGISRDGKRGFVSNEADGTVSAINLESGTKIKDITVGPHLSHPEGIAMDPQRNRAYVAVTHQDLIAVLNTDTLEVERTLSVGRPQGVGTAPVHVSVTRDGCRLLSANSGEDAVAIFRLSTSAACGGSSSGRAAASSDKDLAPRADRILQREGRRGVDLAENEAEERAELLGEEAEERAEEQKAVHPASRQSRLYELIGRVPVASYPVAAEATPDGEKLTWIAAKGLGVGPNTKRQGDPPIPEDTGSATSGAPARFRFRYLPSNVFGTSGIASFPSDERLRELTPRTSRQIRPVNGQEPPRGTPLRGPAAGADKNKIKYVWYIVRENRTYDQVLGDDPRGDGDPSLTLFGEDITPNAHALAKRFPLLDHVYANSEASIDGHFWTSAGAVSDYVQKNWHQNYGDRKRPYDFGVYAVTWPSQRFLFDQAEKQNISYTNWGEAIAGTVPLPDKDRNAQENAEVSQKFSKSDLGVPQGCFPNDASSGGIDEVLSAGPGPDIEVYDSSLPGPGDGKTVTPAPPGSESRFDCFSGKFDRLLATEGKEGIPKFQYFTYANDHTAGTRPGRRTPNAMIAENDWALGQMVDKISHSPVWKESVILVIEDDSQDGADHVDAHRIPAFVISPYAKRGAVVHTRYDFLSFIRTLEIALGMKPLNLFDALAVPMYDAFDSDPSDNDEPYNAIVPNVNMTERNTAASPNAKLSSELPLGFTDRTPQRFLDKILWQYVHGPGSEPPPPGPNAAGIDEDTWRRGGALSNRKALEEARELLGLER